MDFEKIVNPVVKDIPPSGIRKFFDLANQMEGVISLGVGEPDFATPWTIREAAIYSIEKGKTFYTANQGLLELRKEMVELYDKLRIKSDSARVMTTKNVENVRGEKESAIRILENEQRKYWHIIGQSDEKYGIGFIPLFREQYRDIANVKIEEAIR